MNGEKHKKYEPPVRVVAAEPLFSSREIEILYQC